MEKMSRMSKYKDLREGIKTEVVPDQSTTSHTVKKDPVRDADYYKSFLSSEETTMGESAQLKNAVSDDTLLEPMTFDTINSQTDEELERALNRVRQESGQEDFNTRMDILNKIRQSKMNQDFEEEQEEVDEEEFEDNEEDDEEEQPHHRFGFFKRHKDELEEESDDESLNEVEEDDEDDDEDEENSTLVKVLNGIIVVLSLVTIALFAYIAKKYLF